MPSVARQRFEAALDSLVEEIREDNHILAAILCGSLSHDEVWDKSDIDLVLVCTDDKKTKTHDVALVEACSPRPVQLRGGRATAARKSASAARRLSAASHNTSAYVSLGPCTCQTMTPSSWAKEMAGSRSLSPENKAA